MDTYTIAIIVLIITALVVVQQWKIRHLGKDNADMFDFINDITDNLIAQTNAMQGLHTALKETRNDVNALKEHSDDWHCIEPDIEALNINLGLLTETVDLLNKAKAIEINEPIPTKTLEQTEAEQAAEKAERLFTEGIYNVLNYEWKKPGKRVE